MAGITRIAEDCKGLLATRFAILFHMHTKPTIPAPGPRVGEAGTPDCDGQAPQAEQGTAQAGACRAGEDGAAGDADAAYGRPRRGPRAAARQRGKNGRCA